MSSKAFYFLIFLFTKTQASWGINRKPIEENFSEEYGVDTTSPIHHYLDKNTFYGQRYDKMISGFNLIRLFNLLVDSFYVSYFVFKVVLRNFHCLSVKEMKMLESK
jgi:hypothetical protein